MNVKVMTARRVAASESGPWQMAALQLLGALLTAVAAPYCAAILIKPDLATSDAFFLSLAASLGAITISFWLFRNLADFPGIRPSYYILPVFCSVFGSAWMALFMTRLAYSRPLLILSFVLALAWFYLVYFKLQRGRRPTIALAPFGRAESLLRIASVDWSRLDHPELPMRCRIVVADFDHPLDPEWQNFLAECTLQGVLVLHYKQLRQSLTGQVDIERLSENAHGTLAPNAPFILFKQVIDRALAALLLVALLPAFAVIALWIRCDSPGPAIFRQTRVGYRGKTFEMWKFRTMVVVGMEQSADSREMAITRDRDPRVTSLGATLRRSRIDELPQLINVLAGQMSLIGPRPEAVELSRWYEQKLPFYRYRHVVRPGISGWAQVNQGHVADLDGVHVKLHYDFFYISRCTIWLDLLIVLRTVKTMATGFGSR